MSLRRCLPLLTATACFTAPVPPDHPPGWLYTEGNRVMLDGQVWQGRGANIHDTRSCGSCLYHEPNVDEVLRRIDALTGDWGADLVRFNMESYGQAADLVQWGGVLDSPTYLEDLETVVEHVSAKPGIYLMISPWIDPTLAVFQVTTDDGEEDIATGWPSADSIPVWQLLAERFADNPRVIFGLADAPHHDAGESWDAQVWMGMNDAAAAIRAVEDRLGTPRHLVAVQGTDHWGQHLDFYLEHPIAAGMGEDIVYESQFNDGAAIFPTLFEAAEQLPVMIGKLSSWDALGTSAEEADQLMTQADEQGIPYAAWTFHEQCVTGELLADERSGSACGVDMELVPTDWGEIVRGHLQR